VSQVTQGVKKIGDVEIAYDLRGSGPPVLLVSGFSMTRAMWDEELCDLLASHGLTVVRMDNRDTGASTRLRALGVPNVPREFLRSMLGLPVHAPYRLEDMAKDSVGLMRALGHDPFHVVGASMGGMIAQTIALEDRTSLLTMTSIMSTPGGRRYSFASPRALGGILDRVPKDPLAQVEHFVRVFRRISGTGLPFDEPHARRLAESLTASKPSAAGSARQFVAILESSSRRRARLPSITTPTLVIHGSHDPLLPVRGSRAMAKMIPGAELLIVDRMGHHFPATHRAQIADAIVAHTRKTRQAKAA
jgi:pimeloyl-ACP methyl ester carboxylesterase